MTIKVEMVTFDSRDAYALADWWARQTGGRVQGEPGADFVTVAPAVDGGVTLGFQRVAEPTPGKNRVHLEMAAESRDLEVERLLAEGALEVARHEEGGFSWVTLADPDGNVFDVSQG
jgi:hypothetical protein